MWTRLLEPVGSTTYIYGAVRNGELEGYVVFQQKKADGGYDLDVRDFAAPTPRALRSLWTFINDHRSLGQKVSWHGPSNDPLQSVLFEQRGDFAPIISERWMIRVLDVARALEARGYPTELDASIELEVEDDLFPENAGRYRLEVAKGDARVLRGGTGDALRMHVRGLAPLYSSLFTARQLATLGWVTGSDAALRRAEQIFHGPEPWMTEGF